MKENAPNNPHNLAKKQNTTENAFQDPLFCRSFTLSWMKKNQGFE